MSPFDDDQDMRAHQDELLLSGQPVPSEPELAAFVAVLRSTADVPAPRPSLALSTLLRDGLAPTSAPRPVRAVVARRDAPRLRNPLRYVAGLGLAAKILLGAGVAAASVTGAATIDAVPDVVQRPASALVSGLVDLVTPGAVVPKQPSSQPGGAGSPASGNGPAGTATDGGAPATAPSAPPAAPSPAASLPTTGTPSELGVQVPVDPGAILPVPPEIHGLLESSGAAGRAPVGAVAPLPPVVPPALPDGLPGLAP